MSDAARHQPLLSELRNQRDFDGDQKFCSADSGEETGAGLGELELETSVDQTLETRLCHDISPEAY